MPFLEGYQNVTPLKNMSVTVVTFINNCAEKKGGMSAPKGGYVCTKRGVCLHQKKIKPYSPKGYRRRFFLIYLIYLRGGLHPLDG